MRFLPFTLFLLPTLHALKIATSLQWIEHTPQPWAIKNFYKGSTSASLTSSGVANLGTDTSFDLAANAETQGLKQYANHCNIRLIYIICEVAYRIVADGSKGIKKLEDLKGKKIGGTSGTSAGVFVHNMMSSVGVSDGQYTLVSGRYYVFVNASPQHHTNPLHSHYSLTFPDVCMKASCASNTYPSQLKSGALDAFGIWEPVVELGAQALGSSAPLFQNASLYREVYALYSTTEALGDAKRRADIVEFVRALNKTLSVFSTEPEKNGVYDLVAKQVGMDASVVKAVWPDHKWSGRWDGKELVEFLVAEDKYLAGLDKRSVVPRRIWRNFWIRV